MIRIFTLLLLCCAPSVAFAQALPKFNVDASCKAAASKAAEGLTTVQACLNDEQSARTELSKRWSTFPAKDRRDCIAEVAGFEPSYVELLECVTMAGEARQMEKDEAARAQKEKAEARQAQTDQTAKKRKAKR